MTEKSTGVASPDGGVMQLTRDGQLQQLSAILSAIPMAEASDDGLDIALRMMGASSWQQLNIDGTGLPQSKDLVGRELVIRKLERRESDKDGALPWYFVVDATDAKTDRDVRFSTGSATIMAQLAMLHALGNLPAVVTITETITRSGQKALQLVIAAAG